MSRRVVSVTVNRDVCTSTCRREQVTRVLLESPASLIILFIDKRVSHRDRPLIWRHHLGPVHLGRRVASAGAAAAVTVPELREPL